MQSGTMQEMEQLDPELAWKPIHDGVNTNQQIGLNEQSAAHLLRRAGFGASAQQLRMFVGLQPETAVDRLLAPDGTESFDVEADRLANTLLAGGDPKQLAAAWVYRMLNTPHQLLEKTVLLWHGHFATSADKVQDAAMMWQQNRLLRKHALGDFAELVAAIAKDPAMLVYLDSESNRKAHPNENFARELMELFCLGEGNYTEKDVQELSRCFTGWEIRNGRFRKNRYQQDTGIKTVLSKTGNFDGEEAVSIVLSQPQAANFIAGKIYRYFVSDEPAPSRDLLAPLAETLRSSDMQIAPVLRQVLCSRLFYATKSIARKIRSPVEMIIGLIRGLDISANTVRIAADLQSVGQGLFFPPNVKGWDGGRAWINSSTLLGRANMVQALIFDEKTKFGGETLSDYLKRSGVVSSEDAVQFFCSNLLALPIATDKQDQLVKLVAEETNRESRFRQLLHSVCVLPEFQIG